VSEVPDFGNIKSQPELSIGIIALIQNIVVLWQDAVIVAEKYLEGMGTGSRFEPKTNIRMRIIGWVRCKRLIPSGDNSRLLRYFIPARQGHSKMTIMHFGLNLPLAINISFYIIEP
jgi:hypothetical protein